MPSHAMVVASPRRSSDGRLAIVGFGLTSEKDRKPMSGSRGIEPWAWVTDGPVTCASNRAEPPPQPPAWAFANPLAAGLLEVDDIGRPIDG